VSIFSQEDDSLDEHKQTIEDAYKEMEIMKKEYYDGLKKDKENLDKEALEKRKAARDKKLNKNKTEADSRIKSTAVARDNNNKAKSKSIDSKKTELLLDNKKKLVERSQTKVQTKEVKKKQQITKINKRKQALMNRYSRYSKKPVASKPVQNNEKNTKLAQINTKKKALAKGSKSNEKDSDN
jgi:hypothetical protein